MSESDKNSIKLEQQAQLQEVEGQQQEDDIDHDNDQIQEQQQMSANVLDGSYQQLKKRSHRKLDISNFIMKTYKILQDKKNCNIVEWTDQGNCFIVKDKQKFSKQILPKYFKHSKFSSFVRQLNMYDFHKIRKQKQIPIFKHKFFQEGRLDLLHKIKRKSGQDGNSKEQEFISKQLGNISEPNIESKMQTSYNSIKISNQLIPSTKSEVELLKKQNLQLQQSINDLSQQIEFLEMIKEKKKEKLVKIITSIMFFDLNRHHGTQPQNSYEICTPYSALRHLQQHFVKDEEPLSFSEYRNKLADIYGSLKAKLLT